MTKNYLIPKITEFRRI